MLNVAQMAIYRAERAKGCFIASALRLARNGGIRLPELDWDGNETATARIGDYDIAVMIEQDYFADSEGIFDGAYSDAPVYAPLPWGKKRRWGRHKINVSMLTQSEREYRVACEMPSERYGRDYQPWYTSHGGAHVAMDYYWRTLGYSKADAYDRAMSEARADAKEATDKNLDFLSILVTVERDGVEVAHQSASGLEFHAYANERQQWIWIKEQAAAIVDDALRGIQQELERRNGVLQPSIW